MDSDFESSTVSRVTTCNDYMTTEYFNKLLEEKNYNKIIRDILIKRITADELSGYDYSFIILAYSHLEQDDNADFYYNLALKNKKFSEENIIFLIQEFNEMENYNCAITVGLEAIELNLFSKENKLNFFEYADEVGAYNAIITMAKKLLQDSDINKKAKLDIHCKTMHALNCKEQYQSAIEYFNKILKDGETSEDIFSQAIFSYYKSNKFNEARKIYKMTNEYKSSHKQSIFWSFILNHFYNLRYYKDTVEIGIEMYERGQKILKEQLDKMLKSYNELNSCRLQYEKRIKQIEDNFYKKENSKKLILIH